MPAPAEPQSLAERLNLSDFIAGLVADLQALRTGSISVPDARARAELARQILRGVHYVVEAQKVIEGRALPAPARRAAAAKGDPSAGATATSARDPDVSGSLAQDAESGNTRFRASAAEGGGANGEG